MDSFYLGFYILFVVFVVYDVWVIIVLEESIDFEFMSCFMEVGNFFVGGDVVSLD